VLAELVAVANARGVSAGKVLEFLTSLLANPDIETVYPGELLVSQAIARLISRQNRGCSLCDAISFSLMSTRSVTQALTTDQHFEQEGFVRLLK
jgi:predicted nucleic acid-binding protein